jgi:lysophospholipase L1-like esterase
METLFMAPRWRLLSAAIVGSCLAALTLTALAQDTGGDASRDSAGNSRAADADAPLSPRDAGPWSPTSFDRINPNLPTLFIVGDSTAATGGPTTRGWGAVLIDYFDPAKINIVNAAVGGRSFRTFTSEGRWDRIVKRLKPGDFVIIELGHNDGGGARSRTGRGDVPGTGDETESITRRDGSTEVVHTFGWYVRKYIRDARTNGATPIVSSTTVRNIWRDGRVERGMGRMLEWANQVAREERAPFLDHSNITADVYEDLGAEAVARFFPRDHTHTSTAGAVLNAETLIAGLKTLEGMPLAEFLNAKGLAIAPHGPGPRWSGYAQPGEGDARPSEGAGVGAKAPFGVNRRGEPLRFPPGVEPGMPHPVYRPELPTLWLIGDSTVKEGRDNGLNGGRWGWGRELGRYFDLDRINVENQALGGTSSRSFRTEGWWKQVREMIRPGDFVMIQFGHNDGGLDSRVPRIRARATLPGSDDETQSILSRDGQSETVYTYGWYLRQYVGDVRAAGATPIICTLIPRNTWRDGKVVRGQDDSYVLWAREAAEHAGAPLVDLNHIICEQMDAMGEEFARGSLFRPDDGTHTTLLGAQLNAYCVVSGIKALGDSLPLANYLSPTADPVKLAKDEFVLPAAAKAQ